MKYVKILMLCFCTCTQLLGQQPEVLSKIHYEAEMNSHVMKTISYLSDVHGPRLMGTPNYYAAVKWTENQLKDWGITKTYLQSFDNGQKGWAVKNFQVEMIEPTFSPIIAYPLAYTSSTKGVQIGEVLFLPNLDTIFTLSGQLEGKIILLGSYYEPVHNADYRFSRRLSNEELENARNNPDPNDVLIGYHSRRSTSQVFGIQNLMRKQKEEFFKFCEEQKVLALIEPSDFPYGILHADGNRAVPSYMRKNDITPITSFVIANEHFGRLVRLMRLGHKPKLKINAEVEFYNEPKYNVNVIAEIEGTDPRLKDELVVIGAHLDSWHSGTGAVDNASGCATMMEVLRILKAIDAKPKRTIRLALWGGEEQIFAGSSAYIAQNVGDLINAEPKAEKSKISAYFNLDNGAGKIRGIYLMANDSVKPIFEQYLKPFEQNNILTIQNANQTDHELFDFQNIPAFQFIQDPLDYMTAVHHTNMDLYEYIPEKDQRFNAEIVAYLTYQVAQRDELLPRKKYNSPVPSLKGNVAFQLQGYSNANQVSIVGDFNNWNMFGTPLAKVANGWECKIDLPKGKYVYKFIIDGDWTADPATPKDKLVKDGKGHAGLTEREVK